MKTVEEIRTILQNAIKKKQIIAKMEGDKILFHSQVTDNSPWIIMFTIGLIALIGYYKLQNKGLQLPEYTPIVGAIMTIVGAILAFGAEYYSIYDFGRGVFYFCGRFKGLQIYKSSETNVREIIEMGTTTTFVPASRYSTQHFSTGIVALLSSGEIRKITDPFYNTSGAEEDTRVDILCDALEIPGKHCSSQQMLKVVGIPGERRKTFKIIRLEDDPKVKLDMELNGKTSVKRLAIILLTGILLIVAFILYTRYMR